MYDRKQLKFRKLTEDKDLFQFSQLTDEYMDVNYPMEYLRRSKVVAIVLENPLGDIEQMLGGYIIALEAPFRVIQQLPIELSMLHRGLQKRLNKSMELTGLWMHPSIHGGPLRLKFWWNIFLEMVQLILKGTPYFVYSYNSSQTKLGKMYSLSKPKRIYEGPVFIEGMKGSSLEIVEVGSTISLVVGFVARPIAMGKFMYGRLFRRRTIFGRERCAN